LHKANFGKIPEKEPFGNGVEAENRKRRDTNRVPGRKGKDKGARVKF
jgi:hypothetical protein